METKKMIKYHEKVCREYKLVIYHKQSSIVGRQRLPPTTFENQRKTIWLLAMTYGRPCKEEAREISLQRIQVVAVGI